MKHLLPALLVASTACAGIPAFPMAEGAGAQATGGRGGSVYIVTSLNKDGPGSLAEAVSEPNRIIVFAVSGIIDLDGKKLDIQQPNLTIAGQSAPGEGICLKHGTLRIAACNVIVRHLRVRRGFIEEGNAGDAVELNYKDPGYVKPKFKGTEKDKTDGKQPAGTDFKPITDIVLDHVSASWATDENFTMSGHIDRVHAQWCLIAEGLDYANLKQTPTQHAFGSLFGGAGKDTQVGMHHSIFAHHRRRTPQCSAGDGSGDPPVTVDFRNNIVYDSVEAFSHTGGHPIRLNFINNFYKAGPSTLPEMRGYWFTFQKSDESRLYASGNMIYGDYPDLKTNPNLDNWNGILYEKKVSFSPKLIAEKPFDVPAVSTQNTADALDADLTDSGSTLPSRDAVDARVTNQIRTGTGKVIGKESDLPEAQRWPDYRSLPPLPDADQDGLPDFWEHQHGLNSKDRQDSVKIAADGYSFIEHYLNNSLHESPGGRKGAVAYTCTRIPRSTASQPGVISFEAWYGTGDQLRKPRYKITGDATSDDFTIKQSFSGLYGVESLTITRKPGATSGRMVVVELLPDSAYHIGCPSRALVVIE